MFNQPLPISSPPYLPTFYSMIRITEGLSRTRGGKPHFWQLGMGNWVTLDAGIHFPRRKRTRRELGIPYTAGVSLD
jgi:hypothetical protein